MNEFILIHPVQAHAGEEEKTSIGTSDFIGPFLALLIIIAAIFIARRINKQKKHESHIDTP